MRIVPPPAQLLVGEQLLVGGIGAARLRQPIAFGQRDDEIGAVGIEASSRVVAVVVPPIELLAALDIGLEIGETIDRRRAGQTEAVHRRRRRRPGAGGRRLEPVRGVEAAVAGRPVGKRQVIVEADEVDVRRRPQRVEMRPLAVLARVLPAHPARPVGGIGDEVGGVAVPSASGLGRRRSRARRRRARRARRRTDSPMPRSRRRRSFPPCVQAGPRIVSRPRSSEPIRNRLTPPATAHSHA